MSYPYFVNDPDLGPVTVIDSFSWNGLDVRKFINAQDSLCVGFWNSGGALLGQPVRFKYTDGGLVAADFPGVSSAYFVTNGPAHGGGDGSITNG